jgi:hypothetical protein
MRERRCDLTTSIHVVIISDGDGQQRSALYKFVGYQDVRWRTLGALQELDLAKTLEVRQQNLHARIVVFSGHVHNDERYEHGGVTYFVTGGAGARAYPIERAADDPFQSKKVSYLYLLAEVDQGKLKITMHRLDLTSGTPVWTQPDSVAISVPAAKAGAPGK